MTQQQILDYIQNHPKAQTKEDLYTSLQVLPKDLDAFDEGLKNLCKEGLLLLTKKQKYMDPLSMGLIFGTLQMSKMGNFGFLIPKDSTIGDIFIGGAKLHGALHGDTLFVTYLTQNKGEGRPEGEVFQIVHRHNEKILGIIDIKNKYAFVIPSDTRITGDIYIPKKKTMGAKPGQVVEVEITAWRKGSKNAEGVVTDILGHQNDPGMEMEMILHKYHLRGGFSKESLRLSESLPESISEEDVTHRLDLRGEWIITIDGDDAKDLDDAVHVKRLQNGHYELGVHIADVSHYVKTGDAIDMEAQKRGTSVYLPGRVLPMLPQKLSNGICSLHGNVDRLTVSCIMEISDKGQVVSYNITPSVIHSKRRCTYDEVNDYLLDGNDTLFSSHIELKDMFHTMAELQGILYAKRQSRGAIDFDFKEVKVIVGEEGEALDIVPYERRISHKMIEEFMLIANETVSEHLAHLMGPNIYRVHEKPDADTMMDLALFLKNFKITLKGQRGEYHPREIQRAVLSLKGHDEERVLHTMILRSLKKARYTPEQLSHYALAVTYYTHFTSPIRRYPDLMIHRFLKKDFDDTLRDEDLNELCNRLSKKEKEAEMAEREATNLKKAEFMMDHLNEKYEGIVSGITNYGFYVELPNLVEGLVKLSDITDDYYIFDPKKMELLGERTKKRIKIGMTVPVAVKNINLPLRQIDFKLLSLRDRRKEALHDW